MINKRRGLIKHFRKPKNKNGREHPLHWSVFDINPPRGAILNAASDFYGVEASFGAEHFEKDEI